MSILITGATGFIGKALVKELSLLDKNIFILVRSHSLKKASLLFSKFPNVRLISGDLTHVNVLNDLNDLKILACVTEIIHLGGGYNIQMSEEEAYLQNVLGTQNLLALTRKIKSLKRVHLTSSFSVVGNLKKSANATDYACSDEKLSAYSKSKMQAEKMAMTFIKKTIGVDLIVYRPGIVIPDNCSSLEKIDGPFYLIRNLLRFNSIIKYLPKTFVTFYPYSKDAYLPLVSVGCVAKFIASKIDGNYQEKISSFYIVDSNKKSVRNFIEEILFHFDKNLNLKPFYTNIGKRLNTAFGLMPKELSSFGYFSTELKDSKNSEESLLIKKHNNISVKMMIDQTREFMAGEIHD